MIQIKCNKCNKLITPIARKQNIHIGLYCPICSSYIKWANKKEKSELKDVVFNNMHTLDDCEVAEALGVSRSDILDKIHKEDLPWN